MPVMYICFSLYTYIISMIQNITIVSIIMFGILHYLSASFPICLFSLNKYYFGDCLSFLPFHYVP